MKPANNAPMYACMYAELAEVFRTCGYALAVHGSMARDFDLIAIPWTDAAAHPNYVVGEVCGKWGGKLVGEATTKPHGRVVYTIAIMFGATFLDLGFMPREPRS